MLEPTCRPALTPGRLKVFVAALLASLALIAACGAEQAADEVEEPTPLEPVADVPAETGLAEWRSEPGFLGRHWDEAPSGDSMVLLQDSVTIGLGAQWQANGMLRNESAAEISAVEVTAVLIDGAGQELERASARVPVSPIRPGEPVPFQVSSGVAADEVAEVSWQLGELPDEAASRSFELETYWDRPYGDPRPVDVYAYSDQPDRPHSHVSFGSMRNDGGDVSTAQVVGAWVERETGRVLWVAQGKVLRPAPELDLDAADPLTAEEDFDVLSQPGEPEEPTEGSDESEQPQTSGTEPPPPAPEPGGASARGWEEVWVPGGGAADILFVVPAGAAPAEIADAELYIWGMGR